jgi:hypothetical protein
MEGAAAKGAVVLGAVTGAVGGGAGGFFLKKLNMKAVRGLPAFYEIVIFDLGAPNRPAFKKPLSLPGARSPQLR